ncbi:hypothetical protein ACIFOT_09280 [Neobacillus sp. NRS-1170]|uniref:hypothetical protein n=1 Tax=Neobacillus sp. NRS-1170 TaxID=3233898 RepID=UPI003D2DCCDA
MILKSLSDESSVYTEKLRDFFEAIGIERVIFVPYGVRKIYIRVSEYTGLFYISMWRKCEELAVSNDFLTIEESLEYAKTIAKESGLSEEAIEFSITQLQKDFQFYSGRRLK